MKEKIEFDLTLDNFDNFDNLITLITLHNFTPQTLHPSGKNSTFVI